MMLSSILLATAVTTVSVPFNNGDQGSTVLIERSYDGLR